MFLMSEALYLVMEVVVRVFLKAVNTIAVCLDRFGNIEELLISHGASREAEKVIVKTEFKILQCNT
jgi:hypothetical protein